MNRQLNQLLQEEVSYYRNVPTADSSNSSTEKTIG